MPIASMPMPSVRAETRSELLHFTAHLEHFCLRRLPLTNRAARAKGAEHAVAVQVAVRLRREPRHVRTVLRVQLKGIGVRRVDAEAEQSPRGVVPAVRRILH